MSLLILLGIIIAVGGSGGSHVGHPTNRYYYDGSRASMPDYPNNKWHGGL